MMCYGMKAGHIGFTELLSYASPYDDVAVRLDVRGYRKKEMMVLQL